MKKEYEPDRVREAVPLEPAGRTADARYLRPGELLSAMERFPVAYQPLGTIEWHGRHNPLGVDGIKVEELCFAAAVRTGGVVFPTLWFSVDAYRDAGHGVGVGMDAAAGMLLPGSVYRLETELFYSLLRASCQNYLSRGFQMVVCLSGHQVWTLSDVVERVSYDFLTPAGERTVLFGTELSVCPPEVGEGDHAGFHETSMMLHPCPDCVRLDANDGSDAPDLGVGNQPGLHYSQATAGEGARRFSLAVDGTVRWVQESFAKL